MLTAGILFSFAACGDRKTALGGFELGHFDGSDLSKGYDTDLLYKNTSEFLGGDSGIMWVSKEEDPEYGGYFYQYMSECASVANYNIPSTENGKPATTPENASYVSHIVISRSKDLYDWQVCGAIDNGMGLKLGLDAFTNSGIWAPETIHDPKSGKYFMYFGSQASKAYKGAFKNKYGHLYTSEELSGNLFTAGVAVADNPCGPFELVTSENYYNGGTNLNGEILTATEPTFDFVKWYGNCGFDSYCTDFAPFFDENGDLYLVWNAAGGMGINAWGIKMKDMATPDYSTITLLMSAPNNAGAGAAGDDGPADLAKPWRDGRVKDPVRVEYKGNASKNSAIAPKCGEDTAHYATNEGFVNDPAYPRYDVNSYIHWEEWKDGTPNTKTIEKDGVSVPNPAYNAHEGVGLSTIREGVQVISHKDKSGKTKYYLTMTYTGVQSALYDVHFAVSSTPLGNVKGEEFELPKGKEFSTSLGVDINNDYMSNLGHVDYVEVDGEWWIAHWEWTVPFGTKDSFDIGRLYALSPMTWFDDETVDYYLPLANGPTQYLQAKPSIATGYRNIAGEAAVTATNAEKDTLKYLTDGYTVTKTMYADKVLKSKGSTQITLTFDSPRIVRGLLIYNSYDFSKAFGKVDSVQFNLAEKPSWYTGTGDGLNCFIKDLGFPETAYNAEEIRIYSGIAAVATFNELKAESITITISDILGSGDELNVSEIVVLGK